MDKKTYEIKKNLFVKLSYTYFKYLAYVDKYEEFFEKIDKTVRPAANPCVIEIEDMLKNLANDDTVVSLLYEMCDEGTLFLYSPIPGEKHLQFELPGDLFDYLMKEKGMYPNEEC